MSLVLQLLITRPGTISHYVAWTSALRAPACAGGVSINGSSHLALLAYKLLSFNLKNDRLTFFKMYIQCTYDKVRVGWFQSQI